MSQDSIPDVGGDANVASQNREKMLSQVRLVSQTLFAQDAVKQLRENDFNLDSKSRITMKLEDCILVLFYVNNNESSKLAEIWSIAAQQIAGPIFAACNLMIERKVAEAFTKLGGENTALHWAALKSLPFILVYQNGWPVAFYNGERAVQPIIDYALTLVCSGGYREEIQFGGGITVNENYEMGGYSIYSPIRTTSSQYTTQVMPTGEQGQDGQPILQGGPIRQFNETIPVVLANSPIAQQIQQQLAAPQGSSFQQGEGEGEEEQGQLEYPGQVQQGQVQQNQAQRQLGYPAQGQLGYPAQRQLGYPAQGQLGYPAQGQVQGQIGYPNQPYPEDRIATPVRPRISY